MYCFNLFLAAGGYMGQQSGYGGYPPPQGYPQQPSYGGGAPPPPYSGGGYPQWGNPGFAQQPPPQQAGYQQNSASGNQYTGTSNWGAPSSGGFAPPPSKYTSTLLFITSFMCLS